MRLILLIISFSLSSIISYSQPYIDWQKSFGGNDYERPESVLQTQDGGYIIAGISFSKDGDVTGNKGMCDAWVIKLKADRSVEWKKNYGGSDEDGAYSIQQLDDGSYIIAGYTKSNDIDVTGFHGETDYWIIKIDNIGTLQWQKALGGSGRDVASAIKETADGGFIVSGYTMSGDGNVSGNHNATTADAWIVKLSGSGNIEWQKCIGGGDEDLAISLALTNDNGYVFTGYSKSSNGNVAINKGSQDAWVVKLNSSGNLVWLKTIGGTANDVGNSVIETADGGFYIAGTTSSVNGNIAGNAGFSDGMLIKLTSSGTVEWTKCYGGTRSEGFKKIVQLGDGTLVTTGSAESSNGAVSNNYGNYDYWVTKINLAGDQLWDINLGGNDFDDCFTATATSDNGIVVAGTSFSRSNDVNIKYGAGDIWVVKVKSIELTPNIIKEPFDTTICKGRSASFSVEVTAAKTLQWQIKDNNNWINISDNSIYTGTTTVRLTIQNVTGLDGKKYRCVVSNTYGKINSLAVSVYIKNDPVIKSSPQSITTCSGNYIDLNVVSENADQYKWEQRINSIWVDLNQNSPVLKVQASINNLSASYRSTITNSCASVIGNVATVTGKYCDLPNAFSPNGDNINDLWVITIARNNPKSTVQIFNRTGSKVYQSEEGNAGSWDGTSKGNPLPVGVYYYLIDLRDGTRPISGTVTILR